MNYTTIDVQEKGPIVEVILARPEVRNAFNHVMIGELADIFQRLALREKLRAIVLKGRGRAFCSGADIEWMQSAIDATPKANRAGAQEMARMLESVDQCPCPVIARVHRAAFGGGLGLIGACDIVAAADNTKFSFAEVRVGLIPAVISSFTLRKIGLAQARRFYLSGETFNAETAQRINLVHEVVPEDRLDAVIRGWVRQFLRVSPRAVREAKNLLNTLPMIMREDRLEFCVETIARMRVTPEAQEGLKAFLEKRDADFVIRDPEDRR